MQLKEDTAPETKESTGRISSRQTLFSVQCLTTKEEREEVNWTTLYITGKDDFKDDVRRKLEHSRLDFMPGYTGSTQSDHDMYWVNESTDLRSVKEAIGSKLVWKYRLRFYSSLEDFIEAKTKKQSQGFTPEELELIHNMKGAA